jgi:hypothetical protein
MQGISMGTVLGILTVTEREIKRCQRKRPEPFRHFTDSNSVNDRELGSNDSLGEDKEEKIWRLV